jgi:tetratricopeptide (TPR) repeat protein
MALLVVEYASMPKDLAAALRERASGNELFATGDYTAASARYTAALASCPLDERASLVVFASNRAACHLQLRAFEACLADCNAVLAVEPAHVKALLRRGAAQEALEHPSEALEDFRAVLAVEPGNSTAREAVTRLPAVVEAHNEKVKAEMMGA